PAPAPRATLVAFLRLLGNRRTLHIGQPEINKDTGRIVYAKRPIDIYQAPERTSASAETTRYSRAQEPAEAGENRRQRGRDARIARARRSTGSAFPRRLG